MIKNYLPKESCRKWNGLKAFWTDGVPAEFYKVFWNDLLLLLKRGVGQGCSLSLYLFNLCVEIPGNAIRNCFKLAMQNKSIHRWYYIDIKWFREIDAAVFQFVRFLRIHFHFMQLADLHGENLHFLTFNAFQEKFTTGSLQNEINLLFPSGSDKHGKRTK